MAARPSTVQGLASRRSFLKVGSFAMGGLTLADLIRLRAAAKETGGSAADTSVIVVWLQGGPSHIDTYAALDRRDPILKRRFVDVASADDDDNVALSVQPDVTVE